MKWLWLWLAGLFSAAPIIVSPLPSPAAIFESVGSFRYSQWLVDDFSRLTLGSNLKTRRSALEIKAELNCEFLTNAGFYDTAGEHLGWFQVEGREISPAQINRLFNGFLASKNGQISLDFQKQAGVDWGIQSGPVLVYDAKPLKLTIIDDQPRRRTAAAVTREGQLTFLVFLAHESDYGGPLLADLPGLIKTVLPEADAAINLDGGSASAFLSETVFLPEYSPIGGYFCYT